MPVGYASHPTNLLYLYHPNFMTHKPHLPRLQQIMEATSNLSKLHHILWAESHPLGNITFTRPHLILGRLHDIL